VSAIPDDELLAAYAEREELRDEVRRLRTRLANVERDRRQLAAMRNAGDVVRVPLVRIGGGS
jgi:50S ribosomal subunit-associated GTPase HflX